MQPRSESLPPADRAHLAPAAAPRLTIGVLTKNEARRIEGCLRSADFADEVLVVDSGSTDDTVALARACGATVWSYPDWQGFAVQRNRLLGHATGDYVFFLDADEEITPALRQQLQAAVRSGEAAVWKVRWSVVAFGRELKYLLSQSRPERLFRRDMLQRFEGAVHEHPVVVPADAPRRLCGGRLLHYSRESVHASLLKMVQYAMLGAAKRKAQGRRGGVLRGLASGVAIFVRLYVLRLGFTGGGPGFLFCFFIGLECFFRYAALSYDRDSLTERVGR
jgi:glycosyltransferase involved in cell wall biosynthesis